MMRTSKCSVLAVGALVGDVSVPGRIGLEQRAVHADDAHLGQPQLLGVDDGVGKARLDGILVIAAERADRVMVGVRIAREIAHADVAVRGLLDSPGRERAHRITVDQQRQHHRRRILLTAAAPPVHREGGRGHRTDDLQ